MPTDSAYNGQIAYARMTTGKNSFKKGNTFDEDSDPFGFKAGLTSLPIEPIV
jgi:hypothetical protein